MLSKPATLQRQEGESLNYREHAPNVTRIDQQLKIIVGVVAFEMDVKFDNLCGMARTYSKHMEYATTPPFCI